MSISFINGNKNSVRISFSDYIENCDKQAKVMFNGQVVLVRHGLNQSLKDIKNKCDENSLSLVSSASFLSTFFSDNIFCIFSISKIMLFFEISLTAFRPSISRSNSSFKWIIAISLNMIYQLRPILSVCPMVRSPKRFPLRHRIL